MNKTKIPWTDETWNPLNGCTLAGPECEFCYAMTLSARFPALAALGVAVRSGAGTVWTNRIVYAPHRLAEPLDGVKPRWIFMPSMSDLFHVKVDVAYIRAVLEVIRLCPHHVFILLTKRPDRVRDLLRDRLAAYADLPNLIFGTSIGAFRSLHRIAQLREAPARHRVLSIEPLLEPIVPSDLRGIDWVIAGGESGAHLWNASLREKRGLVVRELGKWLQREDRAPWVRAIRDRCIEARTAFFFKQWGGARPDSAGRVLDGRTWDEYPVVEQAPRPTRAEASRRREAFAAFVAADLELARVISDNHAGAGGA